jgi:hypothetical protein
MTNQPGLPCAECYSTFIPQRPGMSLCDECAHLLYGFPPCAHDFQDGRCAKCGWDGSVSPYLAKEKLQSETREE